MAPITVRRQGADRQCFGSGSGLDPDLIGSVQGKMIHKKEKAKEFHVWKCWMPSLGSEGFSYGLEALPRGTVLVLHVQYLILQYLAPPTG